MNTIGHGIRSVFSRVRITGIITLIKKAAAGSFRNYAKRYMGGIFW
jgi:hypothetical protein